MHQLFFPTIALIVGMSAQLKRMKNNCKHNHLVTNDDNRLSWFKCMNCGTHTSVTPNSSIKMSWNYYYYNSTNHLFGERLETDKEGEL